MSGFCSYLLLGLAWCLVRDLISSDFPSCRWMPGSRLFHGISAPLLSRLGWHRVCSQSQAVILQSWNQIGNDWGLIREGNLLYSPPPKVLRGKMRAQNKLSCSSPQKEALVWSCCERQVWMGSYEFSCFSGQRFSEKVPKEALSLAGVLAWVGRGLVSVIYYN